MEFKIKNYRTFEDSKPLVFTLDDGFIAFIGPNNSGKSFAMRFFYEFRNLWDSLSNSRNVVIGALRGENQGLRFNGVNDQSEVFSNLNKRDIQIEYTPAPDNTNNKELVTKIIIYLRRSPSLWTMGVWVNGKRIRSTSEKLVWGEAILTKIGADGKNVRMNFSQVFEDFENLRNSMYIGAFRNAINEGGVDYFDISVGTKFIKTWKEWKSGPSKAQNDVIQGVQADIKSIFKFDSLEIIDSLELNTLQVYVDDKSYKLNELGSGIAQFIMVLGNVAIKEPGFIFIDEPELHLHPSLQLEFLLALGVRSKRGVVFSTHSIGLARSIAGAGRIYSITRGKSEQSVIKPFEETPLLAEFLGELSYRSFRDLGFNKILLVEGPTELKTIQQFLRLYKKEAEVVILPLGGSSMINGNREFELNEIKRISDDVSVLIDSEKDTEEDVIAKDRESFVTICKKLGFNTHVLERRATENYLTEGAIQEIKGEKYNSLDLFQKLEDSTMPWGKQENWKIAARMKKADIQNTDLGAFIKKI